MLSSAFDVINLFKRETAFIALTRYGHIKTAEQRAVTRYNTVIGTLDADGWVQRGGDRTGPQPTQALPRCTKCNSPPINGQHVVRACIFTLQHVDCVGTGMHCAC